jgi:hypothetical protein
MMLRPPQFPLTDDNWSKNNCTGLPGQAPGRVRRKCGPSQSGFNPGRRDTPILSGAIFFRSFEPAPSGASTNKLRSTGGKAMLTITLFKSAMLIAGLVLTSVFLQMALSYGNLPLVVGQ